MGCYNYPPPVETILILAMLALPLNLKITSCGKQPVCHVQVKEKTATPGVKSRHSSRHPQLQKTCEHSRLALPVVDIRRWMK